MKTITDYKPRKEGNTPIAFFHYREGDGTIQYQGYITHLRKDYTGTCHLFSWFGGYETDDSVIHVTRAFFDSCTFYDSDYQMNRAYETHKANSTPHTDQLQT